MPYRLISCVSALLTLFVAAPAMAAELLVVASTAPGFKSGAIIDGSANVSLDAGQKLTLITPAGKTLTLNGPYAGAPDTSGGGGNDAMLKVISALVGNRSQTKLKVGAVRGLGTEKPADPFLVDVGSPGTHCVRSDEPVQLWRAQSSNADDLIVRRVTGANATRIAWSSGEAQAQLPSDLRPQGAEDYEFSLSGGTQMNVVKLVQMPGDLPSLAHQIAWMAEHGCERQARLLLDQLG